VQESDHQVADPEQHTIVSEGLGDGERNAEHRRYRGEHGQPNAAFVDVDRAG
jgi:hypothetical protein